MNISVNSLSKHRIASWHKLLEYHPNNTIFQSYDMYSFYKKVQNFEPFLFLCADEVGDCVGVLLAVRIKEGRGVVGYLSSRVVIYGGPIIDNTKPEQNIVLELLLRELVLKLKNKSIFIQFRNYFEWNNDDKSIFLKYGFSYKDRLNLIVDTTSKDITFQAMSQSKRRQIRKGLASGGLIVDPIDENEVKIFYQHLVKLYKNKVRKPLPHWSFFKEFYEFGKNNRLGIIKLIKYNNSIIGGILCPITPGKNIYEWYVVGLDSKYKNVFPSILATWAPIDFAIKNNLNHFDFMGLGKPDDDYGVRDFKLKFGKNVVNYGRFGRRNKVLYPIIELLYNIYRRLRLTVDH